MNRKCDFCLPPKRERAVWQAIVEMRIPGEGITVGALGCQRHAKERGFATHVVANYIGPTVREVAHARAKKRAA